MSDDPAHLQIAALSAISDLVVDLLSDEYDEAEILSAINDAKLRFALQVESRCFVYSRSTGKWHDGQIEGIVIEDSSNTEWLTVKYQKKKKQIQRFNAMLQPIGMGKGYRVNKALSERVVDEFRKSMERNDAAPNSTKCGGQKVEKQSVYGTSSPFKRQSAFRCRGHVQCQCPGAHSVAERLCGRFDGV